MQAQYYVICKLPTYEARRDTQLLHYRWLKKLYLQITHLLEMSKKLDLEDIIIWYFLVPPIMIHSQQEIAQ